MEGGRAEAVEPVHSWVERAIRRDPSFPASQRELFSVIADSLHLIRGPTLEIYDILKDPEETRNLSGNVGPIPQLAILRDSTPMP
jgi:hypothetical protein